MKFVARFIRRILPKSPKYSSSARWVPGCSRIPAGEFVPLWTWELFSGPKSMVVVLRLLVARVDFNLAKGEV